MNGQKKGLNEVENKIENDGWGDGRRTGVEREDQGIECDTERIRMSD